MHVCVSVCVGEVEQRTSLAVILLELSALLFSVFYSSVAYQVGEAGYSQEAQIFACLCLSALGSKVPNTFYGCFRHGFWGLSSGPYTCPTNILLSELSP